MELQDFFPESSTVVKLSNTGGAITSILRQIVTGKAREAWGVSHNNLAGGRGWVTPSKQEQFDVLTRPIKRPVRDFEQIDATREDLKIEGGYFPIINEAAGEAKGKLLVNSKPRLLCLRSWLANAGTAVLQKRETRASKVKAQRRTPVVFKPSVVT